MSDKEIYRIIADELETKSIDAALWAQAKETALGDPAKTEAIYIRLRFVEIIKSSILSPKSNSLVISTSTAVDTKPVVDKLSRMRIELEQKLLNQGKHSLYSILKLRPGASDSVIATTIRDFESGALAGSGITPAEFKYAKDTLSNPDLREQYDRQLFESVSNTIIHADRSYALEGMSNEYSWWDSSKTSVIIGVLLFVTVGYLGINYMKMRNSNEIQKIAVESQKEALKSITNSVQMKTQADLGLRAETSKLVEERQNQEMELRNRSADRMRDEQRRMQEERMQADEQQKQAQKVQADNLTVMREKQYWSCMNIQMSQRNATSYDAGLRCGMYR